MIILGGAPFFDHSNLNIDWQKVQLLSSYKEYYIGFTDGEFLYEYTFGPIRKLGKYDPNIHKLYLENPKESASSPNQKQLAESFYVKNHKFYSYDHEVLEPFDADSLHTIISKNGYKTNFITDGKQLLYSGSLGGYRSTTKNGKEFVITKDLLLNDVDFPSLKVLGRDLLSDKNAIYFRNHKVPFDKLNSFKFIIKEM